jgi:uncharacterized protein (DUF1800 family)
MPQPSAAAADLGHLVRRAGFGWGAGLEGLEGLGYEQAVDRLLADLHTPAPPPPADFDPYRPGAIQGAWLGRLLAGRAPLAERLTFFWHGHFATSQAKVVDGVVLWRQLETLRAHGAGRFEDLLLAMSRDVAMIRWLDGNANRKGHPNENYARELLELFALGRGAYDEGDVREVARAFTGWGSRHHDFVATPAFHDGGEKAFLGARGAFDGAAAVRIVAAHPACAPFVCAKLARAFVTPRPPEELVARLVSVWRASDGRIADVLRALLLDPVMRATSARRALVRSPVELVLAAARHVGRTALPPTVEGALDRMGQVLFRPPSVKGWTEGQGWLTAGALLERVRAAQALVADVDPARAEAALLREWDGALPPALARRLEGVAPAHRLAWAFASPEFQVA